MPLCQLSPFARGAQHRCCFVQGKCLGQGLGKEIDVSVREGDAAQDGLGVPALLRHAGDQGLLADSEPHVCTPL